MTISSLNVPTYSECSIVHTISQDIQQFGYNNTLVRWSLALKNQRWLNLLIKIL